MHKEDSPCQNGCTSEFELPDEVAAQLHEAEMAVKAKEALVMELLREHHISQGKTAEILGICAS